MTVDLRQMANDMLLCLRRMRANGRKAVSAMWLINSRRLKILINGGFKKHSHYAAHMRYDMNRVSSIRVNPIANFGKLHQYLIVSVTL